MESLRSWHLRHLSPRKNLCARNGGVSGHVGQCCSQQWQRRPLHHQLVQPLAFGGLSPAGSTACIQEDADAGNSLQTSCWRAWPSRGFAASHLPIALPRTFTRSKLQPSVHCQAQTGAPSGVTLPLCDHALHRRPAWLTRDCEVFTAQASADALIRDVGQLPVENATAQRSREGTQVSACRDVGMSGALAWQWTANRSLAAQTDRLCVGRCWASESNGDWCVCLVMVVKIISMHRIENFFLASGVPDVDGPVPDADGALRGLICRTISQPQTDRR